MSKRRITINRFGFLGGGANVYLGMFVSTVQYATVAPATPFVAPVMLIALVIDLAGMQYQIVISKTHYDTSIYKYQT